MKFSEFLAARVLELEYQLSRARKREQEQRRRAEMWRVRAMQRNSRGGRGSDLDGQSAPLARR